MVERAIDTNVLIAANGRDTHADPACRATCIDALVETQRGGRLLLDAGGEVLAEYSTYCAYSGQPGVGDEFFRWAFQNQGVVSSYELHPSDERGYVEFPDDERLSSFDPSDRKFVALVAVAGEGQILNALDSDYRDAGDVLRELGVVVIELCEHQVGVGGGRGRD